MNQLSAFQCNFLFITVGSDDYGAIKILEDNTGAIKSSTNDAMASGRRHARVKYHHVCHKVSFSHVTH